MSISGIHNLDVLRWEQMTDTVRKFPSTGPHYFRNNLFTTKKPLRGTDIARWDELSKTRKRAPYQVRGAPAQRMEHLTRGTRVAQVADIYLSKQLNAAQIEYLRQYGTQDQEGAMQVINDELEDMVDQVHNTVEHACMSTALGSFSVDQSASTAAVKSRGINFTLTFATTALTSASGGGGPGKWSDVSKLVYTTGFSQIFDKAEEVAGYTPDRCIINRAGEDKILKNTEVKSFVGEQYKTELLRSGHISNIRGVDFTMYNTGDDDGGSWAKYWDDDRMLFLPPDNRYFELFEADALIPSPDGQSLVRATPGMYSYSVISNNPPGIELFVGYRFLPVNRYPERVIDYNSETA